MLKKLRWFLYYRKTIRKNKNTLLRKHGLRIDWVNRMYKTYTLTDENLDELKSYGPEFIDRLLEKDRSKIEETLIELRIHQFVGLMEIEPLNERQIGVAFRYKYFDTAKIANMFIWSLLFMVGAGISYLVSPKYVSIIIGLLSIFGIYLISRLFVISRTGR
jgi:hypothetical protein